MNAFMIGIAGGSGSGKTTFTHKLQDHFGDKITAMYHDNYYKSNDDLPFEQRAKLNFDHPNQFDNELFIEHLKNLKEGKPIECPTYDYSNHLRSSQTEIIEPKPVILVDGILIFENEALRELFDLKIFVDTDADIRILRRITRDISERGRTFDSVMEQYMTTVRPMHDQFVEPSKCFADMILLNGGKNKEALKTIISRIDTLL